MPSALPAQQTVETETVRKSDLVRLLGQLHVYTPIREDMAALGFRGEKLDLAVAQIVRMLQDPLIAGDIADRVMAAQVTRLSSADAGGLFWPLVDRGLAHLPLRDLRYFYVVEQAMLKALPERICGRAIRETLSQDHLARETGRVAARLNIPALKEYYRVQYKAARLGATRDPARLSPRDEARAVRAINRALGETLARRSDGKALTRAYENLGRAGNRRACTAGQVFMDAVLTLKGRDLHLALILLSTP